jgi:hypothetical protein
MTIKWNYRKSCCDFSLYEKIGMISIVISMVECYILMALNIYVGTFALLAYIMFIFVMTDLEKKNIIEVKHNV